MKRINKILFPALAIIITGVSACVKDIHDTTPVNTDFSNSAIVQIVVATANATRNQLTIDNANVQATNTALASGSIYPQASFLGSTSSTATFYGINVAAGLHNFYVRDTGNISATTGQQPLSFAETFQPNRHYTVFLYDTSSTPKQKTVLDDIVVPTDNTVRLRFANFVYNSAAVPAIDIFSFTKNANIFTNVPTTDVTPFISYPAGVSPDTLYIRETGTQVNLLKVVSSSLVKSRSYTLLYRGSYKGTKVGTIYVTR